MTTQEQWWIGHRHIYNMLSSLVWLIPKRNLLIIEENMNAQVGKDVNNKSADTIHQKVILNKN